MARNTTFEPCTTCPGSGEEFGLSDRDRSQIEEGREGCWCLSDRTFDGGHASL